MKHFRQCHLKKDGSTIVTWVEIEKANLRNILSVKINNMWDDGWEILSVSETILSMHHTKKSKN